MKADFKFLTISLSLFLSLLSSGCVAQGTMKATVDQAKTFKIPADFNGYSAQLMRGPSWGDVDFVKQVAGLKPAVIRYPGGTVASYWDWKTGWLMKGIPLRRDWAKIPENPLTIKDLKFACDASGAVPILVLNMMNSDLAYQLEFLRAVKQEGMPVKYVELENEIYLGEEFYIAKFPTGKDYAEEANKWIAAIKKEFPGVKVAVIGCAEKEIQNEDKKKYEQRTNTWNRDVLSVLKNADAMTFHIYGGSGLSALNRIGGDGGSQDKEQAFQAAFDKPGSEVTILGIPFARWATTQSYDYTILPSGMEIWITEYNLFEKEGVLAGTWAHGLYALTQSMLFMGDNKTAKICYHNLSTSAQFAAIFNNETGFEKSVKQKPTDRFGYSAAGWTLQLFGKAMDGATTSAPLRIQGVKMQKSFRGMEYPSVLGIVTTGKHKQVLLVNLSGKAETIDLSGVVSGNITWSQLTAGIKTQVASEKDVRKLEGKGSAVKMEPFSVTLVRVNE